MKVSEKIKRYFCIIFLVVFLPYGAQILRYAHDDRKTTLCIKLFLKKVKNLHTTKFFILIQGTKKGAFLIEN